MKTMQGTLELYGAFTVDSHTTCVLLGGSPGSSLMLVNTLVNRTAGSIS
jgi:hypothetical protein